MFIRWKTKLKISAKRLNLLIELAIDYQHLENSCDIYNAWQVRTNQCALNSEWANAKVKLILKSREHTNPTIPKHYITDSSLHFQLKTDKNPQFFMQENSRAPNMYEYVSRVHAWVERCVLAGSIFFLTWQLQRTSNDWPLRSSQTLTKLSSLTVIHCK